MPGALSCMRGVAGPEACQRQSPWCCGRGGFAVRRVAGRPVVFGLILILASVAFAAIGLLRDTGTHRAPRPGDRSVEGILLDEYWKGNG